MQGGKFTVEAVGQSTQFLAGISTWPVDRLFVRVELAQAPALGTGRRQVMRLAATSQVEPRGKISWPSLMQDCAERVALPEVLEDQL